MGNVLIDLDTLRETIWLFWGVWNNWSKWRLFPLGSFPSLLVFQFLYPQWLSKELLGFLSKFSMLERDIKAHPNLLRQIASNLYFSEVVNVRVGLHLKIGHETLDRNITLMRVHYSVKIQKKQTRLIQTRFLTLVYHFLQL